MEEKIEEKEFSFVTYLDGGKQEVTSVKESELTEAQKDYLLGSIYHALQYNTQENRDKFYAEMLETYMESIKKTIREEVKKEFDNNEK